MGPQKEEGGYWGYEETGNGQLQSVQSFQLTTNNTRELCYRPEKLTWSNKTKLGKKQVFACEGEYDLAEHCLLKKRKFLGFTMADAVCLAYQLAVRSGIKNQFCARNEKTGRKCLKIFLQRHQEILVTNPEGLHSQERGVSLLNQ